jgi:hypothetical protein
MSKGMRVPASFRNFAAASRMNRMEREGQVLEQKDAKLREERESGADLSAS